jgi:hypothetical protein
MTYFAARGFGNGRGCCSCVASEHAEARAKCGDIGFVEYIRDVVDGDTTVASKALDLKLRDAFVGAVAGAEIEHCGPVVAKVFRKGAACACGGGG